MDVAALERKLDEGCRIVGINDDCIGIVVNEWDGLQVTAHAAQLARQHGGRVITITPAGPGMLVLVDGAA
jgi:hypothetical protein